MHFDNKTRELKLVDATFLFFSELAATSSGNDFALSVCQHLQAMKGQAIGDRWIAPFIDLWHSRHPEEDSLTNDELLWILVSIEANYVQELKNSHLKQTVNRHPDARFKVINGGLSEQPDRPYANLKPNLREHTFADF